MLKFTKILFKIPTKNIFRKPHFLKPSLLLNQNLKFFTSYLSYEENFKSILNDFIKDKQINPKQNIIKTLDKLKGARFGFDETNVNYIIFCQEIEKIISFEKNNFNESLEIINKLGEAEIINNQIVLKFYKEFLNNFSKLTIFEISKAISVLEKYFYNEFPEITENKYEFQQKISQENFSNIQDFYTFVEIFTFFRISGLQNEVLLKTFENFLLKNKKELLTSPKIENSKLIELSYTIFKTISHENVEIVKFLNQLLSEILNRDMLQYDLTLHKYEVSTESDEYSPQNVGLIDDMQWESLSKLVEIISNDLFNNYTNFHRVQDAIIRKSETSLIDFKNAANLLNNLAKINGVEIDVYMRIVEMNLLQIENYGVKNYIAKHYFVNIEKEIVKFLEGIFPIFNNELADFNLLHQIFIDFANYIENDITPNENNLENLRLIYNVFECSPFAKSFEDFISNFNKKYPLK